MIKLVCDNRLRIVSSAPHALLEQLRHELTFENPQHKKLVALGFKYNKEPKFYSLWRTEEDQLTMPRGAMQLFREVVGQLGLEYEVEDRRTDGNPNETGSYEDAWMLSGKVEFPPYRQILWAHQRGIVDAIIEYEQCLIRSPTGSGKTSALIAAIAQIGLPSLVIMWDSGLLTQWQERIEAELGIPPEEQGLIRGKVCRLRGITLAMQQTLNQYKPKQWAQILPVFGLVACDEVQRYAANTFTEQVDKFPARYRIGVSADERRKDGKEFIIYSMFGKVRHEVDRKELIDKRLIHEVEVYVVPTDFTAEWYRKTETEDADGKPKMKANDFQRLLGEMQDDKARNTLALHLIDECVKAGLPTLSFTHFVDHAKIIDSQLIQRGIKSGLALGGDDCAEDFSRTIAGLRDGSLMVGCGTFQKLGVGHDIPTVAAGIAVTPVHNNRSFLGQVKGRICRTSQGKENARIIVLWDRHVFGMVPIYNLKKWNEVMRVWCTWENRWLEVEDYLKGLRKRNGRDDEATIEKSITGIFASR